jgi:hypothetical protein
MTTSVQDTAEARDLSVDERLANAASALLSPAYPALVGGGFLVQLVGLLTGAVSVALAGLVVGAVGDLGTVIERSGLRRRLRRSGLGGVQRTTVRAVLFLPVAGAAGSAVLVAYSLLIVGLVLASRAYQQLVTRITTTEGAVAVRNLGDDLRLAAAYDRARARRTVGIALICALEIPAASALAVGAGNATRMSVVAALFAGTALVAAGFVVVAWRWSVGFLRSGTVEGERERLERALADAGAPVLVYFSGDAQSTYQLSQWVPVLERLAGPLVYVIRERVHARQMGPTRHPVVYCRRAGDVEVALAGRPVVALYVANAGRNIHLLRYPQLQHVFLNHGDSDKASSVNRFATVYDRLFVAGQVGIDRYRAVGIALPDDRFEVVGRPQLDGLLDGGRRADPSAPPTVLYAPTWEGHYDHADYSSLDRFGPELVAEVLAMRPDVRVVFKPHPLSGTVRPGLRRASAEIERRLRQAGAPHLLAADDPQRSLYDWFDHCDVLITDVSAVATDFLATDKPYLVTNPRGLDEQEFLARFPTHRAAYLVADPAGTVAAIDRALAEDPLSVDRLEMRARVLGVHPGGPFTAFEAALDREIAVGRERPALGAFFHGE